MKKGWLILLVVVVIVAGTAIWKSAQPEAQVTVIRPSSGTIQAYVEEQAVTELPYDHLISMPISGWLQGIELREGDRVTKDQVLARLERDDLEDRVLQARQQIAVLETKIRQTQDHRLEENMLIETEATVKAIDETVQAAEAKHEAARAVMEFAKSEVERVGKLAEAAAASQREIREAETNYRKSRAELQSDGLELAALKTVAAVSYIGPKFIRDYMDRKNFDLETHQKQLAEAQAALEIELRNLARAEIKSPIDGVVLERHQTRRQYLAAGTPLLTLGRLDELEVTAEVLTEQATQLAPGDPVEIFGQGLPDGPVPGKVLRVYPAGFKKISSLGVEQQRVKVAVGFDPPQKRPEQLGVGYRVHVRIYHAEADEALTLPRTALFRSPQGQWQAMVVRDGTTEIRALRLGLMNDDSAEILEGVTAEDQVVARPARNITAGLRVETTE